jgi:hypothetical protein
MARTREGEKTYYLRSVEAGLRGDEGSRATLRPMTLDALLAPDSIAPA